MNGSLNLHPKVAGGSLSGCLAIIVLAIVGHWYTVTPEVAAAYTAAMGFLGSYFAPMLTSPPPPPAPPKT